MIWHLRCDLQSAEKNRNLSAAYFKKHMLGKDKRSVIKQAILTYKSCHVRHEGRQAIIYSEDSQE